MPRDPHPPLRTCVGCRTRRPKGELIRLVCSEGGTVKIDSDLRLPGRGAYLCQDSSQSCLQRARRRRSLARSLAVRDDRIGYESLGARLAEGPSEVST